MPAEARIWRLQGQQQLDWLPGKQRGKLHADRRAPVRGSLCKKKRLNSAKHGGAGAKAAQVPAEEHLQSKALTSAGLWHKWYA